MEDDLDAISRSDMDHIKFLKTFYSGSKKQKGLHELLDQEFDKIESKNVMTLLLKLKYFQTALIFLVPKLWLTPLEHSFMMQMLNQHCLSMLALSR